MLNAQLGVGFHGNHPQLSNGDSRGHAPMSSSLALHPSKGLGAFGRPGMIANDYSLSLVGSTCPGGAPGGTSAGLGINHPHGASSPGLVGLSFFGRIASPVLSSVSGGSGGGVSGGTAGELTQRAMSEKVLLSLRTLGSLTPPATLLLKLLHESVLPYIAVNDSEIRREAAITCVKMLISSGTPMHPFAPLPRI